MPHPTSFTPTAPLMQCLSGRPLQLNRGDRPSTKQHLPPSGSLDSALLCLPPPHWTEVKQSPRPHSHWLVTGFHCNTRHTGDSGSAPPAGMEPIKERTTSHSPLLSPGWNTRQRSSILIWGMWTPKAEDLIGVSGRKTQTGTFPAHESMGADPQAQALPSMTDSLL